MKTKFCYSETEIANLDRAARAAVKFWFNDDDFDITEMGEFMDDLAKSLIGPDSDDEL